MAEVWFAYLYKIIMAVLLFNFPDEALDVPHGDSRMFSCAAWSLCFGD